MTVSCPACLSLAEQHPPGLGSEVSRPLPTAAGIIGTTVAVCVILFLGSGEDWWLDRWQTADGREGGALPEQPTGLQPHDRQSSFHM